MVEHAAVLSPAMAPDGAPEWDGAVWVGEVEATQVCSDTAPSSILLAQSGGYRQARFLVKDEGVLIGFVNVPITARRQSVDTEVLRAEIASLRAAAAERPGLRLGATSPDRPHVTVVICTRDRVQSLGSALSSVLRVTYPNFDVVVVDNASATDATQQFVTALDDPRVQLVVEPLPGLSRARNAALAVAQGEIVAYTDDDVVVDEGWIAALVAGFQAGGQVALVTGIVPSGELRTPSQAYFDQRVSWASSVVPQVFDRANPPADIPLFPFRVGVYGTGANFAVRRSEVLRLGGFDEALGAGAPTKGGEDLDIFFRVLRARKQLVYQPSSIVWHRHRADVAALAAQAEGYGLGLGAWLTKIALDWRTLTLAVWTILAHLPDLVRHVRNMVAASPDEVAPDKDLTRGVLSTELLAILKGPLAYLAARRQGRAAAPLRRP